MRKAFTILGNKFLLFIFLLLQLTVVGQANDNCTNATLLTSNASATCGQTTSGGGVQTGEVVAAASVGASSNFTATVWYRFVATKADMFIELEITSSPSCSSRLAIVAYNTNTCLPAAGNIIQTQQYNGDGAMVLTLSGLTIGSTYRFQVGYSTGGGCVFHPSFCIKVGDTPAVCTCNAPCTSGCGYATLPTVAQVVSNCPIFNLDPLSDGSSTKTYCYSFVAVNSMISFNMIITSNCVGGNVTGFSWTLQRSSCGANVASGTLASMSATGLIIGQAYVLCYTYTIPSTCYHSSLYPYFVGASALSITLSNFDVKSREGKPMIQWAMESEEDLSEYVVLRSTDGKVWENIHEEKSRQNYGSNAYTFSDNEAPKTLVYYKLAARSVEGKDIDFEDNVRSFDNSTVQDEAQVEYFDLNGKKLANTNQASGIILEKTTYVDGTSSTQKIFLP